MTSFGVIYLSKKEHSVNFLLNRLTNRHFFDIYIIWRSPMNPTRWLSRASLFCRAATMFIVGFLLTDFGRRLTGRSKPHPRLERLWHFCSSPAWFFFGLAHICCERLKRAARRQKRKRHTKKRCIKNLEPPCIPILAFLFASAFRIKMEQLLSC